jgi:NADPH2:quinone reductase
VRAIVVAETGGPERLEPTDVPEPAPGEGEELVRVRAAGVNFLDLMIRRGVYPQAPPLPLVPGGEIAGDVDGRRVLGLCGSGGYAELATAPSATVFPLPETATYEEGASFLLTFLSAWLPLTRQVRVEPGSTVLVHAAAGGVGSAAVQLARHLGARVIATASTEEKRRFALELGADEAYSYDEFVDRVRADVVLDPVGGDVFAHSVGVLEPFGSLVAIGSAGGWWQDLSPALLVGRNVSVHGFYLGRLMPRRPELVNTAVSELLDLWTEGAVTPIVGHTFPLAQAAEAHRLIEARRHVGKVVLVP